MDSIQSFPISYVAELINVHPETLRVWERHGIIKPQRKSGKRLYSGTDLKKLQFIKKLISNEQYTIPAITHFLHLYPCWEMENCPSCMQISRTVTCAKPCWKEDGAYCKVSGDEYLCSECEYQC